MKIRTGFVSNSSSASFIIKTFEGKDKLLALLTDSSETNMYEIHSYLTKKLEDWKDYNDGFWIKAKTEAQEMLDMFETKERMIGSYVNSELHMDFQTQKELVEKFLRFRHVHIGEDEDGNTEMWQNITMFNEWSDFGSIIKDAIFLLTVTNTPFKWETDED